MPVIYTVDRKRIKVPKRCPFCEGSVERHDKGCPYSDLLDVIENGYLTAQPYND